MELNEYYQNIQINTEKYLIDNGFLKDTHEELAKIGNVWSGNIDVDEKPFDIHLVIPKYFPDKLPKVYLKKKYPSPLPHVDSHLFVCTIQEAGLLYRQEMYLEVIEDILRKATSTLSDGIGGRNHNDFDVEFLDYWRQETYYNKIISLINPNDEIGKVVIAEVTFNDKKYHVVGKSLDVMEKYFKNINPSSVVNFFCYGWFTKLDFIPRPPFSKTISDAEKVLLPQIKKQMKKYRKAIPKYLKTLRYVIFSVPGEKPLLAMWGGIFKDRKHQLGKYEVERWDADRVQNRIGNETHSLKNKKVCVIGCGSIGSRIAMGIVESGVEELLLIDHEKLEIANIARHLCGASYVDNFKVEAIKKHIEQHFPHVNVLTDNRDILEVLSTDLETIENYNLIISAVGELNINRRLNMVALSESNFPPLIFSFIEAYGIASHALLVNGNSGGCYDCILDNELKFKYLVADFGEKQPTRRESGCQTTFLPYSSEDTKMAASIATRLSIDTLGNKYLRSKHWVWVGDLDEITRLGIRKNPKYSDARSYAIYITNLGKNRECKTCGGK